MSAFGTFDAIAGIIIGNIVTETQWLGIPVGRG
jgi:hypothetical protein